MAIVPLDPVKLAALMLAGGVFAMAGLWLMFRPQVEGHVAVIKLLGMEFQASSAGLLVFLIGAGFLALLIVVPEKHPATSFGAQAPTPGAQREASPQGEPASDERRAVVLPATAGAQEQEPNDHLTEANQIQPDVFYAGRVDGDDTQDWFVISPAELAGNETEVQIRSREAGAWCTATAFDDRARQREM